MKFRSSTAGRALPIAACLATLVATGAGTGPMTAAGSTTQPAHPVAAARFSVHAMSYNILEATTDGHREGGQVVAPWSKRRLKAADLIRQSHATVVGIQEGASWAGRFKGPRQVDSLRRTLGGSWAVAHTEVPPSHKHFFRTGCYVMYERDVFAAVGRGGHWKIGTHSFQRYAAYQILRDRTSGSRFLMVSAHLLRGVGRRDDLLREDETKRLISRVRHYRRAAHLPVVYAGDFNSHPPHGKVKIDGPGRAMRAAGIPDTYRIARSRSKQRFDSANDYERRPPAFGWHIDHIYVTRGIRVRSWRLILDLRHGRFVGVMPSDHNPLVTDLTVA